MSTERKVRQGGFGKLWLLSKHVQNLSCFTVITVSESSKELDVG